MSNLLKKEKGFTLIEIVLVLAIAGLIMVIVFLALSGAQKNRRDTQRKQDNARLLSQLEVYASNNSGNYPANAAQFTSYLPSNFTDPLSNTAYGLSFVTGAPNGSSCAVPTNAKSAAVTVYEQGRQIDAVMCLEQGYQDLTNQ